MSDDAHLAVRRSAGAALRGVRRPGMPLHRLGSAARGEQLRPALAIEALLAAMRARFDLAEEAARRLLAPALADWRDAIGCADPLLVPANAQGAAGEAALVPLPVPSWCAWLVEAGLIRFAGPPTIQGPRVVQPAWLVVVREAELAAVECFPVVFAGRFASGAASLHVHLAVSPPWLSPSWRGPVLVRAAAQRADSSGTPVRLWVGPPAMPTAEPDAAPQSRGSAGVDVTTWVANSPRSDAADWPAVWPRWIVLRAMEGREPQALWDVSALWRARMGGSPEASAAGAAATAAGQVRLAVDVGSTSTMIVEEDGALSGAVGTRLLGNRAPPSGFRRLAGDPRTAHRYGCAEQLLAPGGRLPTAIAAGSAAALATLWREADAPADAAEQVWLPQAPPDLEAGEEPLRADRFKSPELLLLSDWLAGVSPEGVDPARVSRRLLETYGFLLGRTLAAAHAAPHVVPEGGRWVLRWPRLESAEAILTYPHCAWSPAEPFGAIYDGVGRELCRGLRAAWSESRHRKIADPVAARAACDAAAEPRHPIEVYVDFGGLTLQVTVRLPLTAGRPAPFLAGSSMSYLLGGERVIDSAAYAAADVERESALRDAYRKVARRWRSVIASSGHLPPGEAAAASALREAILALVLALVRRQVAGTLRRAAPGLATVRGAGIRLYLLGDAWKLAALDVPDERREDETLRHLRDRLEQHPLAAAALEVHRMTKRRMCEGALRAGADAVEPEAPVGLHGVDLVSNTGAPQRWFAVAGSTESCRGAVVPDPADPWWSRFAGASARSGSFLRVEQWFTDGGGASPFDAHLEGSKLAFDPRRSVLEQWLDVSGASLFALRIHDALRPAKNR